MRLADLQPEVHRARADVREANARSKDRGHEPGEVLQPEILDVESGVMNDALDGGVLGGAEGQVRWKVGEEEVGANLQDSAGRAGNDPLGRDGEIDMDEGGGREESGDQRGDEEQGEEEEEEEETDQDDLQYPHGAGIDLLWGEVSSLLECLCLCLCGVSCVLVLVRARVCGRVCA
jgi:hypothetical protein